MKTKDPILLPAGFAKSGFHSVSSGAAVRRYHVLGERCSGTNFVKRLLGRNSALKPTELLGWKHGLPQMLAIPPDLAVICVVRRAEDWALSMFAKPWHTSAPLQAMPFSDFIRAPWDTIIDRARYFNSAEHQRLTGQPLQQDRDPVTGARFENLFALRRAKLIGLLSYLNRDCTCVFLRMEEAQNDPEKTADRLLNALGQPIRNAPFRPVVKRLGSKFKPAIANRPDTPTAISKRDQDYINDQLDAKIENLLGYTT